MIFECPCCRTSLSLEIATCSEVFFKGRALLNFYIEKSGKKIKILGKEMNIVPGHLSNMRNGRIGIGDKNAMRLARYFNHHDYRDFIIDRIKT